MSIPQPTTGYPKSIYNAAGERIEVVLDVATYEALIEALEEVEDIRAFDEAKACNEQPIPWEQARAEILAQRPDVEALL